VAFYTLRNHNYLAHKSTFGYFNSQSLILNTSFRINYNPTEHIVSLALYRSFARSPILGIKIMWKSSDRYKSILICLWKEKLFLFRFRITIKFWRSRYMNKKKKARNIKITTMMSKLKKKESNFCKKDLIFWIN